MEDDLREDLMMSAADITDFLNSLNNKNIDTQNIDLSSTLTVEYITETLAEENQF